eukprot:gene24297-9900_t
MSYNPLLQDDLEMGKPFGEPTHEFAERYIRQGFVRKVFGLLFTQLAITAAVTAFIMYSHPLKTFMAANSWTIWLPFALGLPLILARRTHPLNLFLLFLFTACESVLVGAASAQYDTKVVLIAVAMTAAVVFGLVLFSFQSTVDVTGMGGILYSLILTLMVASIAQMFLRLPWLHLALCAGGVMLFSVYL